MNALKASRDIRLVPPGPILERDPLEIRCQLPAGCVPAGTAAELWLDDRELLCSATVQPGAPFTALNAWLPKAGKAGTHTLSLKAGTQHVKVSFTTMHERACQLDGGFIMLGPPDGRAATDGFRDILKAWTEDDWCLYIRRMHDDLCMGCIIINAAVQLANMDSLRLCAHYPSKLYPKSNIAADDPIEAILSEADALGMHVFLGVGNNYGGHAALSAWREDAQVLKELYARYGCHSSLYGWYAARECNMMHLHENYLPGLELLREAADQVAPCLPLMISPYILCPEGQQLEKHIRPEDPIWQAPFQIFMPQDMIGLRWQSAPVPVRMSREMHRTAHAVCRFNQKHLWANCEAFDFLPDRELLVPRYHGGGFDGEEGYLQQLRAVEPYAEKRMTFMLSGFFTPPDAPGLPGGAAAVSQYEHYLNYLNRSKEA